MVTRYVRRTPVFEVERITVESLPDMANRWPLVASLPEKRNENILVSERNTTGEAVVGYVWWSEHPMTKFCPVVVGDYMIREVGDTDARWISGLHLSQSFERESE